MRNGLFLVMLVMLGISVFGFVTANAQSETHHKITAQEVAEAMADPSATITYFNLSYRAYQDVGPFDDMNSEMRLNGAGFFNLPDKTAILYRVYLPVYMTDFPVDDSGVGDLLLSAYWVPSKSNLIVGPGAALIAPAASEDYYGTGKWSLGPTLVVAKKVPGKFTLGGLFTHAWSIAGDSEREDVSLTTLLPAFTYFVNKKGTSISLASETTYNWMADEDGWNVPLTVGVGQILPPFGKFFVGVAVGATTYLVKPEYGQEWDVRGLVSIVFP